MTKLVLMGMTVLLLSGCMITDREARFYTRSEIDAIDARAQCRALARNLIQLARCDGR